MARRWTLRDPDGVQYFAFFDSEDDALQFAEEGHTVTEIETVVLCSLGGSTEAVVRELSEAEHWAERMRERYGDTYKIWYKEKVITNGT